MSKAVLSFSSNGTPSSKAYAVTVIRYSRGYQNQVVEAVVRSERHGYPMRVKEQDVQLTIQCRSVAEYDQLKAQISVSQVAASAADFQGCVRFVYPDLGIDLLGFIRQGPEGVARFLAAPVLSFSLTLFQDTIFTQTEVYSTADGTWKDIFGADTTSDRQPSGTSEGSDAAYNQQIPLPGTSAGSDAGYNQPTPAQGLKK